MYQIGPYNFSETDAERTVSKLDLVWGWYSEGRDASVLAPLHPALTGDLATDLELVWKAWAAAGPALRAAGQLPPRAEGAVAHLHLGDGGVPKKPVDRVEVDFGGVIGDRQATRVHHGRPWQALCLWSIEAIQLLQAQGHPIAPGLAGENITVRGLPWAEMRAGVRLQIGGVSCEVSAYTLPCAQNAPWFVDGDFMAMNHDRGPVSRIYATVLKPGIIEVGDPVVLEP